MPERPAILVTANEEQPHFQFFFVCTFGAVESRHSTWSGVDCDVAGHVIGLNLSNESISSGIENSNGLFGLQYLQSLNLAFNKFNSTQIPSRLANLTNLKHLNLSYAGFAGQIPSEISGMTRLVTLDLSTKSFIGSLPLKLENPNLRVLVQNLSKLRELYLDGVNISSSHGNEWCQALSSSLPNLQVLSLIDCILSGPIHSSLADLHSLSVIRLDQNNLSTPVPEFMSGFSNLTSLRLSSCGLTGTFPEKIFQVPTLETLDLSNNKLLRGSVPRILMNNSLQILMLSDTNFSGNTLPDSIGNLKHLSRIELAGCNFNGTIPTSMSNLTELVNLDLSANNFSGQIPSFHMSKNLTYLDLSFNVLSGGISSTDWPQLVNLVYVDLRNNLLTGSIPPSLLSLPSLQQLQLGSNQFNSQVLELPNASSSVLGTLDLSDNRLEGPIPKSIFQLKKLKILLLSSNKFNGTVQLDSIQRLANLTTLDLSYNSLTVNASSDSPFLSQITTLKLASCNLSVIPNLKNQLRLFHLDLSQNQISEEVPNWIWNVSNGILTHLNLSCNLLKGLQVPYSLPNLSVLDLHSNQLQGKIPPPPTTAVYVDYSRNFFTSIPPDIGSFLNFTVFLSLSNNNLGGVIPQSMCNATNLRVLDLSNNSMSGTVPACLTGGIQTLGVLNLRGNNLKGSIPAIISSAMRIILLSWLFFIPFSTNFFGIPIIHVSGQCQSDQQSLLLQMKNSLLFNSTLSVRLMRWNQSTDCCTWSGVDCDMAGRVIGLDLSEESIYGGVDNSTGLFALQHLWSLNLASNLFDEAQIPSRLANLTNLTYLNLSDAGFVGQIPIEISSLTRLVTLDLSCSFTARLQLENPNLKVLVQNFSELRELYLDRVNISAHGNEWGQALSSSLPNLQVLSLSFCFLSGPIHSSLADLHSLSVIRLDFNDLSSPVPEFLDYSHSHHHWR
ncbi:hypothetical protein LWI28_006164 [Acer negundo]|uniref:Leucine-rich repeat-containing N-terminal plant-type domain-containing protein n=1 Tax=Acer negundo TaxID=4023 RepID=A0AAD5NDH4_ACENE|nr:hypothetical protein LWI28_006164 [Acer negundo]